MCMKHNDGICNPAINMASPMGKGVILCIMLALAPHTSFLSFNSVVFLEMDSFWWKDQGWVGNDKENYG